MVWNVDASESICILGTPVAAWSQVGIHVHSYYQSIYCMHEGEDELLMAHTDGCNVCDCCIQQYHLNVGIGAGGHGWS